MYFIVALASEIGLDILSRPQKICLFHAQISESFIVLYVRNWAGGGLQGQQTKGMEFSNRTKVRKAPKKKMFFNGHRALSVVFYVLKKHHLACCPSGHDDGH